MTSSQQNSADTGDQYTRSCLDLKRKISNIKRNPRKTLLFKLHIILKALKWPKSLGNSFTVTAGPAEGTQMLFLVAKKS